MAKQCAVGKVEKGVFVCDEARSGLIPELQGIHDRKGCISDNDMQALADKFGIHPVEVYSVATFYSFLTPRKKGKHVIRISECISNIMAGSRKIEKEFEKALGIKSGETTKDNRITLERTACIGMCDKAPAAMIDNELVGSITAKKVKEIIKKLK
ncbi:MAG: NAD(P)H-dependent oxidoreductase subunit E [Candidatus Omnitrophica bacterium]|nr:NAD(P)H-dependent oxidoreductase subunit E [Candidatus Omnitrophota bacterium]